MTTTQIAPATTAEKLEVVTIPVSDVDRAKAFYLSLGWRLDIDFEPGKGPAAGLDPERRSYFSRAILTDPDGNQWQLQEVTDRLPGRVERTDPAPLAELLLETAKHHGDFEALAAPHNWWDWYAAYFAARQDGDTPAQADKAADAYMKEAYS